MVLNKDSNEVKRFIEAMEGISKILDANSLIYRPILDGHRYITEQELSKALKITKRTLIEYRMNGKLPYYKIGGKILYKEQDIIEILERNKRYKTVKKLSEQNFKKAMEDLEIK